jgi:DNA (cytosine-5)-methyltransferase 1
VAPLRPLPKPLYTVSFFSGVGGFDKGSRLAGFQSLVQSDWWEGAGKAFELNIPKEGSNQSEYLRSEGIFLAGKEKGDITKIHFTDLQAYIDTHLKMQIKVRELDVMLGGPPCQDYSKANNFRDIDGERNHLIFDYLRLIREGKPKVALIEQVPDLLCDTFQHIWTRIRLTLNTMTDYLWGHEIMNAMNYGARQNESG